MTTFIVGGAGFIGTAIINAFGASERGDIVVVDKAHRLSRCGPALRNVRTLEMASLQQTNWRNLFQSGDQLIHLAWSSQPSSAIERVAESAQENVIGSLQLFSAAINAGVDKIIFASSGGTVYGHSSMEPVQEDRPLAPVSGYGAGKASVESYLQVLSSTHGISGISLRIGNPYGPYQLTGTPIGIIANFIRRARDNRTATIFGDGEIVRDYISISDVADAFVMGLKTSIESGAYNIGSGQGKSINEIVTALTPLLPTPLRVEYVAQRSFDIKSIVLNCAKFSQSTGWRPKTDFQSGLEQMLASAIEF